MFRKTFIRLILVTFIASGILVAFANNRPAKSAEQETCDAPASQKAAGKGEFLFLEALGKALLLQAKQ